MSLPASVCVRVYVWASTLSLSCHNSSPIQARITKFGSEVQNTLVKIPIVFLGGTMGGLTFNFKVKFNW